MFYEASSSAASGSLGRKGKSSIAIQSAINRTTSAQNIKQRRWSLKHHHLLDSILLFFTVISCWWLSRRLVKFCRLLYIYRLLPSFPDPNSDLRKIFPMNCPTIASIAFFHRVHFRDLLARQKCLCLSPIYPHLSYLVVLHDRLLRRDTPFVILLATLSDDVDISIFTVKHLCFMLNSVKT